MRNELFLRRLSERERKAFEECMALLETIAENGNAEAACEMLKEYVADREGKRTPNSPKHGQ